jgi:hypothetical protein
MMDFAHLVPGASMGYSEFRLTEAETSEWIGLFPNDARYLPMMPRAMISMVVMRAFMEIMRDRPKGNLHAGQTFWLSALPRLGAIMTTRLSCAEKNLKNGRRWVTFESETVNDAAVLLFRGKMSLVWAA